ncbi:hypothetical protein HRbin06_00737 [archaeon HR06]|nr:hypothetical protein HRbin06_00737 [archaeon HR06]
MKRFYLIASSFFGDLVITMMTFTLPLYSLILGFSPFEIGAIGGTSALVYSIFPHFMGKLITKINTLYLISLSFLLSSLSTFTYSITSYFFFILLARALEGLAWAILWPSLEVSFSLNYKDTNRAFRDYNVAWSLGALMAPLLAGGIVNYIDVKINFYICLVISIFLALMGYFIKLEDNKIYFFNKNLIKFLDFKILSLIFISSLTLSLLLTLFPPYASKLGLNPLEIGIMIFLVGLMRTFAFLLSSKILRDYNKILNYSGIIVILSPLILIFPFKELFYLFFTLLGFLVGTIYSISIIKLVGEAPKEIRGSMAGIFEGTLGLGFFSGPLLGGLVAELDYRYSFLIPIFFLPILLKVLKS